ARGRCASADEAAARRHAADGRATRGARERGASVREPLFHARRHQGLARNDRARADGRTSLAAEATARGGAPQRWAERRGADGVRELRTRDRGEWHDIET